MEESSINEGSIIEGKYGKYTVCKKLGAGGNGKVYSVLIDGQIPNHPQCSEYVVKVFCPKTNLSNKEYRKRRDRFIREAITVSTKLKGIDGIIPIFDHSTNKDSKIQWYLMPRAEKYNYQKLTIEDKLNNILELATTISKLHNLGFSHRDIKPSNILFYNDRLCLADFGLIWSEDFDINLTDDDDSIGPYYIRPPEFEPPVRQDGKMFLKSDVYLFSKTAWIFLTEQGKGYRDRYNRTNNNVYLKSLLNQKHTLEPLHAMMENTTFDEYNNRLNINECIKYIKDQISIFNENINREQLSLYEYEENFKEIITKVKYNETVIKDEIEIQKVLKAFEGTTKVVVSEQNKQSELGALLSSKFLNNSVFVLKIAAALSFGTINSKDYYFKILESRITDKKEVYFLTDLILDEIENDIISCDRFNDIKYIDETKVAVNIKLKILILKK